MKGGPHVPDPFHHDWLFSADGPCPHVMGPEGDEFSAQTALTVRVWQSPWFVYVTVPAVSSAVVKRVDTEQISWSEELSWGHGYCPAGHGRRQRAVGQRRPAGD